MACASGVRGLCVGQCVVFNFAIKVVFPEVVFTNFQRTLGGANRFPEGIPRGPFRGFPDAPPGGPSIGDKGKPQRTPWRTTTWVTGLGFFLLVCFWDSYGGSLKHSVELPGITSRGGRRPLPLMFGEQPWESLGGYPEGDLWGIPGGPPGGTPGGPPSVGCAWAGASLHWSGRAR